MNLHDQLRSKITIIDNKFDKKISQIVAEMSFKLDAHLENALQHSCTCTKKRKTEN